MADDLNKLISRAKTKFINQKATARAVQAIHVEIDKRIFDQGRDSKGAQIGTYSEAYNKQRRQRGLSTGKVILQKENDMRNDWKVLILGDDFASGFSFDVNFDKSNWAEERYKKDIFDISKQEEKQLGILIDKQLQKLLNV